MTDYINNNFWDSYGNTSNLYEVICDGNVGSLAAEVVQYFGLRVTGTDIGGPLKDIDIKHMSALELIKLSLLEASADDATLPYEMFVDYEENAVAFKQIGGYSGEVLDIYHTIQTASYVERCSGVVVTGRDPLPYRKTDGIEWRPIWGENPEHRHIFDTTDMVSNCNRDKFYQQSTIAFRDPHLNTEYKDGIDNLYEITSPFEKIQGYVIQRNSSSAYMNPDVTIIDSAKTQIPIKLTDNTTVPNIGKKLFKPPTVNTEYYDVDCWTEVSKEPSGFEEYGIQVPIPPEFRFTTKYNEKIDNFVDVIKVYVIGVRLIECNGYPINEVEQRQKSTAANTEIWVDMNSTRPEIFGMQYGFQYVIGYDPNPSPDPKIPYVIFGDGSSDTDNAVYGTNCTFNIRPTSPVAIGKNQTQLKGTILPLDDHTGIWVQEVWAIVELNCPSITITDPKGKANDIASNLQYNLRPIIVVDPPPPIAFNGRLIDQSVNVVDHDPTTTQNFKDTPYELMMDEMDRGGGLTLNLSFLNEDQCVTLSKVLYDYMNGGDGIETVYICGPNCNPKLGGYGISGGIINNVQYQYSDRGSYTVSVTEGQSITGDFGSISTGASIKNVESRSAQGNVIDDLGNGIYYKVRVDGFGEFIAFNISQDVIRIGDAVQVTIHNLPVED